MEKTEGLQPVDAKYAPRASAENVQAGVMLLEVTFRPNVISPRTAPPGPRLINLFL